MNFADLEIKGGGKFLKVEPGQPHDVRLLSDTPEEKVIHGFGKTATKCEGDGCIACHDDQPKQRFSVNVYDHTAGKIMKWEFGAGIAKELQKIARASMEEGMKITDRDLKIERTGTGLQDTKWTVTPRMKSKPIPEGIEDIPF